MNSTSTASELSDEQIDAVQRNWIAAGMSGPISFARSVIAADRALRASVPPAAPQPAAIGSVIRMTGRYAGNGGYCGEFVSDRLLSTNQRLYIDPPVEAPAPLTKPYIDVFDPVIEAAYQRLDLSSVPHPFRASVAFVAGWRAAVEAECRASTATQPVAYVPVHPRLGPLWLDTYSSRATDPGESRSPNYPKMALYASPLTDEQTQRRRAAVLDEAARICESLTLDYAAGRIRDLAPRSEAESTQWISSEPQTVLTPPHHPADYIWTALELEAVKAYGQRCWAAGRSVAPKAEVLALRSQDEPVAHVPIHPRSGPLWMDTFARGTDVSQSRPKSYPTMALYASPAHCPQSTAPSDTPSEGEARTSEVLMLELELYRAAASDPAVQSAINAWSDEDDGTFQGRTGIASQGEAVAPLLSDERIDELALQHTGCNGAWAQNFARIIEAECRASKPVAGSRDSFEQWFSEGGKFSKAVERHGDGYRLMAAHTAWAAWQAAWAVVASPPSNTSRNIEPTDAMLEVGAKDVQFNGGLNFREVARRVWLSMEAERTDGCDDPCPLPSLKCDRCGADRTKEDCNGERLHCPVRGVTLGARPVSGLGPQSTAPSDTQSPVEADTQEYLLRAMARNYGDGPHQWDHLDRIACERAADEIKRLRASPIDTSQGVSTRDIPLPQHDQETKSDGYRYWCEKKMLAYGNANWQVGWNVGHAIGKGQADRLRASVLDEAARICERLTLDYAAGRIRDLASQDSSKGAK